MLLSSFSLLNGQENQISNVSDKAPAEKITDPIISRRIAIKTELLEMPFHGKYRISLETYISNNKSMEVEIGYVDDPLIDFNFGPSPPRTNLKQVDLTLRYKNFFRSPYSSHTKQFRKRLDGLYYAPVLSIGNSDRIDQEDINGTFGQNYYASGFMDIGCQISIGPFIGDLFTGVGIGLNGNNKEFSGNISHVTKDLLALRLGYRMGLQFGK